MALVDPFAWRAVHSVQRAGLGEVAGTELEAMISELRDLEATFEVMETYLWKLCPPNRCFNLENMWQYGNMMIFTSWFLGTQFSDFEARTMLLALGIWLLNRWFPLWLKRSHRRPHYNKPTKHWMLFSACCTGSFFCCQPIILRGSLWYFAYVFVWPANRQLNSSHQMVRWSSPHSAGRPQSLNR